MKNKELSERRVLEIALDVAEGLSAAHSAGLTHGDIKPANILLNPGGTAKVVDFGLARFSEEEGEISTWGTPYYMPPEKARREGEDHRSDQYSFGTTLFHMFSGRAPYRGKTPIDVVRSALHDNIPLLENVTPATKDLVRRMMDRNPNLRFPTWKSLKADMELALEKACEADKTAAEAAAAPATSMTSARGFKYQRTSDAYRGKGRKKNSSVGNYVAIGMIGVSVLIIAVTLFKNSPLARERIDTTYSGPRRAAGLPFTEAELAQLQAAVKAAQSKNADACASAFETLRSTIPEKHSAMAWSYFFEGACHLYLVKPEAAQKAFQAGTGPKELIFDEGYRPPEDPRYLCALILGKIDYGEFSKKTEKSERWYRSMTEFALGMRIVVQNGYVMDATRHLKAYQEIETRNPVWAYVGQPLADTMIFQGFNR